MGLTRTWTITQTLVCLFVDSHGMNTFERRFRCYLGISYKRFIAYLRKSSKMDKERERIGNGTILQLFEKERFLRTGRKPELSGRQKWALRESWSKFVGGDPAGTGLLVFTRMFENYPRIKEKFEFLKQSETANKGNNRYMFHVTRVMKFIGRALDHIDHLEEVVPMIKQLGGRHGTKGYNIPAYHFTYFAEAMRQCMQTKLGEWTPLYEGSWREFMDWMTVQLVQGQAEYNDFKY